MEKYLFSYFSKRRLIRYGVGGKYLLQKQFHDFARQEAAIYVLDYLYTLRIWFHVERIPGGTYKQQI